MLTTSQLTRSAAIAATIAFLGASSAMARPADLPLRPTGPVVTAPQASSEVRWTAPRTESPGVRPNPPAERPAATAAAVPLTQPDESNGIGLLLAVAVITVAIVALLVAVDSHGKLARPFRTPQV